MIFAMAERHEPRESARARATGLCLARELAFVLAVKLAALAVLWFVFFRGPLPTDAAQRLAPAPAPAGVAGR
jgi:hypothetical protein